MALRLASIWSANRARNTTAPRERRRRPLLFDGLDRRVLLSGYTPQQIRHAYGFDQIPLDGSGTTIAILEPGHDPNALPDLKQFDQHVEAPQVIPDPPSFTQVNELGQTSNYPTTQGDSLSAETSLDIEWAHAMAPGASILVVEFNVTLGILPGTFSSTVGDITKAIDTARNYAGVVAVSMSFGVPYSLADSSFTTPSGHPGVTFLASTGDNGGAPQLPATSPNVVAVGGTDMMMLDAAGDYPGTGNNGEVAWGHSSGGLTSAPQPAYQIGVVTQSTTKRATPDVAYNAVGFAVYVTFADGTAPWIENGGTSAGAPQWAALIALADQARMQAGLPTLDGASQTLPLLYHLPSSAFNDITIGSNAGFHAGAGYDLVTGRGSPVAPQVVAGLAQPFTVAGGGSVLYQLDSTGNLWQYSSSGWQLLATDVTSFALGNPGTPWANSLFALKADGELLQTVGSGWFDIAYHVTSFALGNPGTPWASGVFALQTDGELMETVGSGFYDIAYNVTSFALGNPGSVWANAVFALRTDGELLETVGSGFMDIAYNVTSFALGTPGWLMGNWLYALTTGGDLMVTNGNGFTGIGSSVASFAVGRLNTPWANELFVLKTDGELVNGLSDIATNVTSFALGPALTPWANGVFALKTDGELMETVGHGFADVATGVASFALGHDGTTWGGGLFALKADGKLMEGFANSLYNLGTNINSFTLAYDGTTWYGAVYALRGDGELMEDVGYGWSGSDYNVTSFALGYDGTPWHDGVFALESNNALRETVGDGWVVQATNVTSFALGYDGTPWHDRLFALKTDGELMESYGSGFFDIYGNVTAFALGYDGTPWAGGLFVLESNGSLMEDIVGAVYFLDNGVKSFLLGSGGYLDVLENSGNLWQIPYQYSGTLLAQSVQSIWLTNDGYTLNARQTNGVVRQFAT